MSNPIFTTSKTVKVGLGDALQRLLAVEMRLINGTTKVEESDLAQRQLILDALNLTQLDLGFDCNDDGVPDTVDIFEQAANTSCCRVVHESESCCRVPVQPAAKQKKTRGKSRATVETRPAVEIVSPYAEPAPTPEAPPPAPAPEAPAPSEGKTRKKKGFLSTLFGSDE